VEKPGAVRFSRAVGVEIERTKGYGMKQAMHRVCLPPGSNIEPEKNIPSAVNLLQKQLTF